MPLISLRPLLDHAAGHGYAVPALNVNNLGQVQAIMQAASGTASPVIVQASAGARKYAGVPFLRHLILAVKQLDMWPSYRCCRVISVDRERGSDDLLWSRALSLSGARDAPKSQPSQLWKKVRYMSSCACPRRQMLSKR